MQIYLVGGAVRDHLSGRIPKDHDFVVVNSSPEEMKRHGFVRVGASYDVYLHPETKEEYVLADNLEDDLKRRDLTINSMAEDEKGNLVDPFGGKKDLDQKILRHTSAHFSDDPLRIYRLARFRAQWPEFTIHPETVELARSLAAGRGFKELHGNRVFHEFKTAMEAAKPSEFFKTLESLNALSPHFSDFMNSPEIEKLPGDASVRFAALCMGLPEEKIKKISAALNVPNLWLIQAMAAHHGKQLLDREEKTAEDVVTFFYTIDVFRRKDLIRFLLELFGPKAEMLEDAYQRVKGVTAEDKTLSGRQIAGEIRSKRIEILKQSKV